MSNSIFIVDDDDAYIMFLERVFLKISDMISISKAWNGRDALDKLQKRLAEKIPLPSLILLDLNMPKLGGVGFLEEFVLLSGQHSDLKKINIVILTSSNDSKDKEKTVGLGFSKYVIKPSKIKEALSVLLEIIK